MELFDQLGDGLANPLFVQGGDNVPLGAHPLADADPLAARGQKCRCFGLDEQVVEDGALLAANFQGVLETRRHQDAGGRALFLDHRIGGDGGAENEPLHVGGFNSGLGRVAVPAMGLYCASKFAVEAMAEAFRYELAEVAVDSVIVEPGIYPTDLFGNALAPRDESRMEAYPVLGEKIAAARSSFLRSAEGKDPGEVARAVADLIALPPGARPLRTRIGGTGFPIEPLNAQASRTQAEVLEILGFSVEAKLTA